MISYVLLGIILFIILLVGLFSPWLFKALFLLPFCLEKKSSRVYGVRCYCGAVGGGKTISMVREAYNIKKRYPGILIFHNMPSLQIGVYIQSFNDLVDKLNSLYPTLILWDEVVLSANARNWGSTPIELVSSLAQNRKGAGCRLLYTVQDFSLVDKQIRLLTNDCFYCRTFGKLTIINKCELRENGKIRIKSNGECFKNEKYREKYDSFETIKAFYSGDSCNNR